MRTRITALVVGAAMAAMTSTAIAGPQWHAGTTGPCAADEAIVPIPEVQGSGSSSPHTGETVTIEGVVTVDLQKNDELRGFFVQDPVGDGDPSTSDGVFVFHADTWTPTFDPSVGDRVRVTGDVREFFGNTEIDLRSGEICRNGGRPARPALVSPTEFNAAPESFEGMLVRLTGSLVVTDTFNLHRFGEAWLSAKTAVETPTNQFSPGPRAAAFAADNIADSVLLDDGSRFRNPDPVPLLRKDGTVRVGDGVVRVEGAVQYSFGNYRIQPQDPPRVVPRNPRPDSLEVDGDVVVATFNVLNYFTTLGERGARTSAQLEAQTAKLVAALRGTGADVLALQEIENAPDHAAILALRDALNDAHGADVWEWIGEVDHYNSYPIRNEILFRSDRVGPVGDPVTIADPAFDTIPPGRNTTVGRPPVAQTFMADGEVFTVVSNHFKSKGCSGAAGANERQGDGQSCFNPTRVAQAEAVLGMVDDLATSTGDPDVLVMGDLNAYLREDPIDLLETELVNVVEWFDSDPYTFNYFNPSDAPWIGRGALDHVLATASMSAQTVDAKVWHINADEPRFLDWFDPSRLAPGPFRSSDHDPIVVGLDLGGESPEPSGHLHDG